MALTVRLPQRTEYNLRVLADALKKPMNQMIADACDFYITSLLNEASTQEALVHHIAKEAGMLKEVDSSEAYQRYRRGEITRAEWSDIVISGLTADKE